MDEPTGGLDVSVQAHLLDLLRGLVRELQLAVVIVTHDLAVARLLADRLMVMRRSRVVESGLTDQILDDRSEEHTSELQSLMRTSYAVFCLKKKKTRKTKTMFANNMKTHKLTHEAT